MTSKWQTACRGPRGGFGALVLCVAAVLAVAPVASAQGVPRWTLVPVSNPTNFAPGDHGDQLILTAVNSGPATADGTVTPITITASLPPSGLTLAPAGVVAAVGGFPSGAAISCQTAPAISCTTTEAVIPGEVLEMVVNVDVATDAAGVLSSEVAISGGGGATATATSTTVVSPTPAGSGIAPGSSLSVRSTSQAGAHPTLTTAFSLATEAPDTPVGTAKNVSLDLPPGVVAAADSFARCPLPGVAIASCPAGSIIGRAFVTTQGSGGGSGREDFSLPIYDIVPEVGEAAAFAFEVPGRPPTRLDLGIAPAGGYHLRLLSGDLTEAGPLLAAVLTLWGVPADVSGEGPRRALLTNPTSCGAETLTTALSLDSGSEPDLVSSVPTSLPATTGCDLLDFDPSITVRPETSAADSPTGLSAEVRLPQNEDPDGLAEAQLKKAVVSLPPGLVLDPSVTNGLQACSLAQIGISAAGVPNAEAPSCPEASKFGTVEVDTPLIDHPLPGSIYLAKQGENPFNSIFAAYLVIDDPATGVLVKLAGEIEPDRQTGRLTASFDQSPQLPVEAVKLHVFGAAGSPFATPATCGTKTTTSELTPWSAPEGAAAAPSDSFQIDQGAGGSACVGGEDQEPDAPGFEAGTTSTAAGTYSPFVLRLHREDGTQRFKSLDVTLPKGLIGNLAGIPYCPDARITAAEASAGTVERQSPSCPAASELGTITVASGAGPTPLIAHGQAYLAGPYKGAPISIVTITPALGGPFDLGTAVDRVAAYIDPETSQIHTATETIPQILDGVPLDVRSIAISLDRPGFMLNPTSCKPMAFSGSVTSPAGASAPLSSPFQVEGCRRLGFRPHFSLRLKGGTKRADFPSLRATLTMPKGTSANLAGVVVSLPHSEFVEQGHIKTICTRVQFAAGAGNGEECPKGSIYGHAELTTPLLEKPLRGPVFQRSSNHKLPDLVMSLRGQIDLVEDGKIDSDKMGGIRTTFDAVPDASFSKLRLVMGGGNKSLLVNSENLCSKPQRARIAMVAQNGKRLIERPLIANDCHKHTEHRGRGGRNRRRPRSAAPRELGASTRPGGGRRSPPGRAVRRASGGRCRWRRRPCPSAARRSPCRCGSRWRRS
jgi:hypothetical protein